MTRSIKDAGKPCLRRIPSKSNVPKWECTSDGGRYCGTGYSLRDAYQKWHNAVTCTKQGTFGIPSDHVSEAEHIRLLGYPIG